MNNYLNIPTISPTKFEQTLDTLIKVEVPAMLWGPPGVGKSQVIKNYARAKGYGLTIRMLSQMQACDFMIPWVHQATNTAEWSLASFLANLPKDEPHILFFDELNAAPADVQVAAYQILLDHQIGEYTLPPNTYIIAAGNRPEDGALASGMNTAIADRLIHFSIQPDANEWVEWALKNDIHPYVTTFIKVKPEYLCQSDNQQVSNSEVLVVPTPRSWERVSMILKANPNPVMLEILLSGVIGLATTAMFKSVLEQLQNLAPVEDYFNPKLKTADIVKMMPTTFAGLYGLAYSIAAYVSTPEQYVHALGIFLAFRDCGKKSKLPVEEVFVAAALVLLNKARADHSLLVKVSINDNYTKHIQPALKQYPTIAELAKTA